MKFSATLIIFAVLLAVVFGVTFSIVYPRVDITSGIAALCALLGLACCLIVATIWKWIAGRRTST